jgi:hypothetical protein
VPLGGFGEDMLGNSFLSIILFYLPLILLIFYGQRLNLWLALSDVARSLNKLKIMKERGRKEVIDYIAKVCKNKFDPTPKVDQILEYFTIMPVSLDPYGIVKKIEHIILVRDERMKSEIKGIVPDVDKIKATTIENLLEIASSLNYIYKIVRHLYLLGKKTTSAFIIIQLQMIMPLILQEADALINAINAFKQAQPIGDGIGPMVVGKMMFGKEKRTIAKDTLLSETEYKKRRVYLMKAEGPAGNVGQPGTAIERLIQEMGEKLDAIIMIDAALKLEGEKSGEVAEGIGAAIGGIGVDRFKIEEVATRHNIPLYAIVIKQSVLDAISVMSKSIAESTEKVLNMVYKLIEEKTKEGQKVLVVGVGNTLGVGQ